MSLHSATPSSAYKVHPLHCIQHSLETALPCLQHSEQSIAFKGSSVRHDDNSRREKRIILFIRDTPFFMLVGCF